MKNTSEKMLVRHSKAEVALAVRLLKLLNTPGAEWFFKAHPESHWDEFNAQEAWECWLKEQISEQELEIYEERYGFALASMSELHNQLAVDSNRIPDLGNVDGY